MLLGFLLTEGATLRPSAAGAPRTACFDLEVLAVFRRVASVLVVLDGVRLAAACPAAAVDPADEDRRLWSSAAEPTPVCERDVVTLAAALRALPLPLPPGIGFRVALRGLGSGRPPVAVPARLFAARVGCTGELDNGALREAAFCVAAGFFLLPRALRVERLVS